MYPALVAVRRHLRIGKMSPIDHPGRRNAMIYSLALQTFRLDIVVACASLNMGDAAIFLSALGLLHIAISSGFLNEDTRCTH
jgi:hypothetical protein